MRIAYVNANYQQNHTGGGHVHMEQFISNAIALGHEVWAYPGNHHPDVKIIPRDRINHLITMRNMDVLYVRIDIVLPAEGRWALPPKRWLYGFPVVVWEFNTSPEYIEARSNSRIHSEPMIDSFKRYSKGCDLAICVSDALTDYVKQEIGVKRVITVSNGSDPELFRPDVDIVNRMKPFEEYLNVVWVGSGKEPWHDIELLKRAAKIIWEDIKNTGVMFHLIGPDLNGIMADMPPNVFYWGAERYQNLPGWLAGMDIGLILYKPGPAEFNSPLKLFDYLASGLGVISTPSRLVHEFSSRLNHPEMVIPNSDADQLVNKILGLKANRSHLEQLGRAGRQLVMEQYNWKDTIRKGITEIDSILTNKRKHSTRV